MEYGGPTKYIRDIQPDIEDAEERSKLVPLCLATIALSFGGSLTYNLNEQPGIEKFPGYETLVSVDTDGSSEPTNEPGTYKLDDNDLIFQDYNPIVP